MRAVVPALLLALALPGCALFDQPAATSTTSTPVTTTPSGATPTSTTTATPDASHLPRPSLTGLTVLPTELPLGDAAAAKVTVVNPTAANLTARVEFLLDGSPALTVTGSVAPNGTLDLGGRLQPSSAGTHAVGARLVDSTLAALTATLHVLGPRLANATVAIVPDQGCNKVTYTVSFTNVGDGPARDVRVTARLLNGANATVDSQTRPIGTLAAGQHDVETFSVQAATKCSSPVTYRVSVAIEPAPGGGDTLLYTSPPFDP